MTVRELIEELSKVEDKELDVVIEEDTSRGDGEMIASIGESVLWYVKDGKLEGRRCIQIYQGW